MPLDSSRDLKDPPWANEFDSSRLKKPFLEPSWLEKPVA